MIMSEMEIARKLLTGDQTGFMANKFKGDANTIGALIKELKYVGSQDPDISCMTNNGAFWYDFIFPSARYETIEDGSYIRPSQWKRQNYNEAIDIRGEPEKSRVKRFKINELKQKRNLAVDKALANIMKLIKDRCNSSFEATWQKFNGDPYLSMQYLIDTYGAAINGISEMSSAWANFISHTMTPGHTFQSTLIEAERLGVIIGLSPDQVMHFLCVTREQTPKHKIQPLPDTMMDAIKKVKLDDLSVASATIYLAKQSAGLSSVDVVKGKGINAIGGKIEEEDENSTALSSKSKKRNRDRLRNTKLKSAGNEKLPSPANNNSIKGARKGANGKPPMNTDATEETASCSFCGRFNHVDKDCYHKKIHFLETTAANAGVAGVPELKSPKVQAVLSAPKKAVDNAAFVSAISQLAALHNQSSMPAKPSVSWNTQE